MANLAKSSCPGGGHPEKEDWSASNRVISILRRSSFKVSARKIDRIRVKSGEGTISAKKGRKRGQARKEGRWSAGFRDEGRLPIGIA